MNMSLEIKKVSRYEADWDPQSIFSGFKVRAILKSTDCMITAITQKSRLGKRLRREIGEEGEDWFLSEHPKTGDAELYLKHSGTLLMWKLQDHEAFKTLFDRVEQHTDDPNEISEDPS